MDNAIPSSSLTTIGSLGHGLSSSATLLGAAGGSSTEDRMEASSDSAVSSMGSERVSPMTDPPISENGWEDNESQSQGSHDLRPYVYKLEVKNYIIIMPCMTAESNRELFLTNSEESCTTRVEVG